MIGTQPNTLTSFTRDTLRILWWSFLYPTRLVAYMHSLHPDLTAQTGFSQQLWLARRSPAVRRFVVMQFTLWLCVGLLGGIWLVLIVTLPAGRREPGGGGGADGVSHRPLCRFNLARRVTAGL